MEDSAEAQFYCMLLLMEVAYIIIIIIIIIMLIIPRTCQFMGLHNVVSH